MNLSIFLFVYHFFFFCYDLNKCKKIFKKLKKVLLKKIIKVQSINFQDYFDYSPHSKLTSHIISYPQSIELKNEYRKWCS
jgi:hypothetical protein